MDKRGVDELEITIRGYLDNVEDIDNVTIKEVRVHCEAVLDIGTKDVKKETKDILMKYHNEMSGAVSAGDDIQIDDNDDEVEDDRNESMDGSCSPLVQKKAQRGTGFQKVVQYSTELTAFMGDSFGARTDPSKRVWAYILEHNLQNPSNKLEIICDDKLILLFKRNKINMFQLTKALSHMCKSLDLLQDYKHSDSKKETEYSGSSSSSKKRKRKVKDKTVDVTVKKRATGLVTPVNISDALAAFLNIPSKMEARSAVVKKIWEYIRSNELLNPDNKREILMDAKLHALFGDVVLTMFSMNKYLNAHFIK